MNEAPRNQYAQTQAGRCDRIKGRSNALENDDGGHLIGSQFSGSGNLDNLVPMNAQINRSGGKWYQMETIWKEAIDAGDEVLVKIEPIYSSKGVSQRPDRFEIMYKIGDGTWVTDSIANKIGG